MLNSNSLLSLQLTQAQFGEGFLLVIVHLVSCSFGFLFRKTCRHSRVLLSHCFSHIINGHSQYFQPAVASRQRKMPPHLHGVRKETPCLAQDGLAYVKRFPSLRRRHSFYGYFTHAFLPATRKTVIFLIVFIGREKLAPLVQITTRLFRTFS